MTHLSRETLIAWRDRPSDELRATVVAHVAACDDCAALLAEVLRSADAPATPVRFDPAAFAARGHELAPAPSASQRPRIAWWAVPVLAAAAIIAFAVVVARRPDAPDTTPPVTRGGSVLVAIAPSGAVRDVLELSWDAPADATSFRVEITDANGATIFETRVTSGRRVALPDDVRARLGGGIDYRWIVSRLDARGQIVESSPQMTFRLSR